MATIERVMQMQQQGMSDGDIIKSLRNEGISSKEISDSLSQAKIKMAVNQEPMGEYQESYQAPSQNSEASQNQTISQPSPQYPQYQEQQYQQPYPQEQYAQYQDQSQQQYSYGQGQLSAETISDIVDRIVIEKLKEIHQKTKILTDYKSKTEEDLMDVKDRLKRIESTIDALQKSIVGKVGEFGQSTAMIHKDLENLHGTVSKLMNPLVDNYNELRKINSKK